MSTCSFRYSLCDLGSDVYEILKAIWKTEWRCLVTVDFENGWSRCVVISY